MPDAAHAAAEAPQLRKQRVAFLCDLLQRVFVQVQPHRSLPHDRAAMHTAIVLMPAAKAGQGAGLHLQPSEGLDELIGFHMCPLLPHKTN